MTEIDPATVFFVFFAGMIFGIMLYVVLQEYTYAKLDKETQEVSK